MKKFENNLPAVSEPYRIPPPALTLDAEFEPQGAHVPLELVERPGRIARHTRRLQPRDEE